MLSKEQVRRYQQMSWDEKFRIAEELTDMALRQLDSLPPEEREKRWAVIRHEHRQYRERIIAHLAKCDR